MAQEIKFDKNGLLGIELNAGIEKITALKYDRIENYPNIDKWVYKGGFIDFFTYYYIISDSLFIDKCGLVKDIFFACDSSNYVRGIFFSMENINEDFLKKTITEVFGPIKLTSSSGIGLNVNTTKRTYWNDNKFSIFFNQKTYNKFSELIFRDSDPYSKSPDLNLRLLQR